MSAETFDRRAVWTPPPRPEWLARFNEEGEILDIRNIVPLAEEGLLAAARARTGLDDFGDDGWIDHFRVLLKSLEEEAQLNFFGRIAARSELLQALRLRLEINDWYAQHPEIEEEEITEPVVIIGMGRCGTTIFHEALSQDTQFRSPKHWETIFPVPPSTSEVDPRIALAEPLVTLADRITPELRAMHALNADLPCDDCELLYLTFLSEIYFFLFQIPSYAAYFAAQDLSYTYEWHKRYLKLLQSGYRKPHWLLKNPSHIDKIPALMATYPDAKIILMHRDPIVSADSVTSIAGSLYWRYTDDPWSGGVIEEGIMAAGRAKMWDGIIGWIEDGTIPEGALTHLHFKDLCERPFEAVEKCYGELGIAPSEGALDGMRAYLQNKPRGAFGKHKYEIGGGRQDVIDAERKVYARYQDYFGVVNEI